MNSARFTLILVFLLSYSGLTIAQKKPSLDITTIMQGNKFVGHWPENISWTDDGSGIYFTWNPDDELNNKLYRVDIRGLKPYKVSIEEQKTRPDFRGSVLSKDHQKKLYGKNGDIFLKDIKTGKTRQITKTTGRESNPVFTNNEKNIVYRSGNNLFRLSLENGELIQLTNFKNKKSGTRDKPKSEQDQWLEKDQLEFFEVLAERKEKRIERELLQEELTPDTPYEILLRGKSLSTLSITPDEKYVVYQLMKRGNSTGTDVSDYVTESGYAKMRRSRPKVGNDQPAYELGIFDILKDTSYIVDTKTIEGIFDKPEYMKEYLPADSIFDPIFKKPRKVAFRGPIYNQAGNKAVVVVRSDDNKDRWIMSIDLADGTLNLLDRQRDEAWVGGPGIIGWNYSTGTIGWLADDKTIYFQSEESGFSHIYTINTDTKLRKQLTSGSWEIYDVKLSKDKKNFFLTANKEGPAERHFYRMAVTGGKITKYTTAPGNYEVSISPDEKLLAIRYSYSNKPWELYLMPNKPGASMQQVTHSTKPDFENYEWREPEIITFKAEDGKDVHARLYSPDNEAQNGPAVIFVHGAGYLQNAHKWWSNYYREFMFHNFLVDNGYTVLDIDYRGSEGYGRDWRTGIYRHMGGKDLSDQVDGAKYLVSNHGVDPEKIGLYGGSYGGFITIFAMLKHSDVFNCGAALRSVTDWAHYNHGYTSNILNTPVEDSIAYKRSSPIYFADGLGGELLMLHGVVDTNVQFQDVVRLSQKFIELGKKNWNVAIFPMEGHGFTEPSSWADEYGRIYELFEKNLK